MGSKHEVRLTGGERQFLSVLVRRGQCSVTMLTRAYILLASDSGEAGGELNDDDLAQVVRTSAATVYRVRKRFAKGGLLWALYGSNRRPMRGLLPSMGT
jgi:hypothetical protein